jgi:integrase
MANRLTLRFQLPPAVIRQAVPLRDDERVGHLGRVLASRDLPLRTRVAVAIVLLYAQPLSRIVRIALDDVTRDGGQVLLRLGDPPSPVPAPAAELLLTWIDSRDNMNTATNHDSPWLFPGRKAGQPMNPNALAALVNDIGIPTIAGRASAIRQHVLGMPAPVVADALGYHPVTTARLAAQAGGTFSRYAPGNHARPSPGRTPGEGEP